MQNVGVGEKLFEVASEIQAPRMENSRREKRAGGCVASLSRRGEYGSEVERQREKEKMLRERLYCDDSLSVLYVVESCFTSISTSR